MEDILIIVKRTLESKKAQADACASLGFGQSAYFIFLRFFIR